MKRLLEIYDQSGKKIAEQDVSKLSPWELKNAIDIQNRLFNRLCLMKCERIASCAEDDP